MSTITTKERIKGKDQGNLEISINENPILRFAPEPSGYLHLGHTKAFFLNLHFSKEIMRIRFDDTNPLKETLEFETALKEDLSLISDKKLHFSRSSDYFYTLLFYVHKFIQQNYAYVDNTPVDLMREERDKGIENKNRSNSTEKNLKIFSKMLEKENKDFCVRAKIDMKSKNKSVRDPVIFRFNFAEHYVYKDSFFFYPTYDFACPIIDSIEGITDVFRSNEYRDRNEQYNWFIDKLRGINYTLEEILPYLKKIKEIFGKNLTKKAESDFLFFKKYCKSLSENENDFSFSKLQEKETINLKKFNLFLLSLNFDNEINFDYFLIFNYFTCKTFPGIIDFSRLSFENTILSKRNLKEIILNNKLTWDDPRIPTLRGILRKGLKIDALKEYILMQGVAQKTSIFSWDKLWSINKKVIDELSGRYFCIEEENLVELEICSEYNFGVQKVPIHRKNSELGTKNLLFSQVIYLDKRDLELIKDSEFTLMYFSSAKIKDNKIFLTDSDPRKSKHKIHWVSKLNSVKVKLIYFDDLLKEEVFNDQSKKEVWCVGEQSLMNVKEGSVVQLERIGFFYCDSEGIYHSVPYTAQIRKY